MKILLLGSNGQVGRALQHSLLLLGEVQFCIRNDANLEDLRNLQKVIDNYKPNVIINAAAYTDVDKSEYEKDKAYNINHKAVDFLAKESKRLDAWLIHYSTDYIFDGEKRDSYTELDETNPLSVYGKSKLAGEKSIQESGCKYIIFRTSWVYSVHGSNFVKTIIRLSKEKNSLNVINDQIGVPTSAELIANVSCLCLYRLLYEKNFSKGKMGIYNLTPKGKTNWHNLATYIVEKSKEFGESNLIDCENVYPISSLKYNSLAKRPLNSLLNTKKICDVFGINLPHWKTQLNLTLQEIYSLRT